MKLLKFGTRGHQRQDLSALCSILAFVGTGQLLYVSSCAPKDAKTEYAQNQTPSAPSSSGSPTTAELATKIDNLATQSPSLAPLLKILSEKVETKSSQDPATSVVVDAMLGVVEWMGAEKVSRQKDTLTGLNSLLTMLGNGNSIAQQIVSDLAPSPLLVRGETPNQEKILALEQVGIVILKIDANDKSRSMVAANVISASLNLASPNIITNNLILFLSSNDVGAELSVLDCTRKVKDFSASEQNSLVQFLTSTKGGSPALYEAKRVISLLTTLDAEHKSEILAALSDLQVNRKLNDPLSWLGVLPNRVTVKGVGCKDCQGTSSRLKPNQAEPSLSWDSVASAAYYSVVIADSKSKVICKKDRVSPSTLSLENQSGCPISLAESARYQATTTPFDSSDLPLLTQPGVFSFSVDADTPILSASLKNYVAISRFLPITLQKMLV